MGMSPTSLSEPGANRVDAPAKHGQTHPEGGGPVEVQAGVGFEEVEVRGDADRYGGGVPDGDRPDRSGLPGRCLRRGQDGAGRLRPQAAAAERIADHGQPGPVVEDRLDVDLGDHIRDAGQDVIGPEGLARGGDGLREACAVTGCLARRVGDERGRLGHVQAETAGASGAGQFGGTEQQQPVALRRGQPHTGGSVDLPWAGSWAVASSKCMVVSRSLWRFILC